MNNLWACISVGITILNAIILVTVKFNDLKHLEKCFGEVKKMVLDLEKRVSFLEGYLKGKNKK